MADGRVEIDTRINNRGIIEGVRDLRSRLSGAGESVRSVGSSIGGMFAKYVGIATGSLAAMGGVIAGIKFDAMAEQSQAAWTTLLGSTEKAKGMMQDISNFAKNTQFETEDVDMMAKYMHNAGLEGKGMFDALMKVADVSGAFNIPAEDAKELTRQMSQVRQAGVAYTEDLNVLQDRGVPIYKALAKQMGTNVAGVKKMASEGKISSDVYIKAFNGIANSVKGASDKQSQTFNGMLSTLSDNLKIISGTLMKGAFNYLKKVLTDVMPIINKFSSTLKDKGLKAALTGLVGPEVAGKITGLFKTIKEVGITAFNGLKKAVKFVSDNFNTLVPIMAGVVGGIAAFKIISSIKALYDIWKTSTIALTIAQEGFAAAMALNPIGLIAIAIGLLIVAIVALIMHWKQVKAFLIKTWAAIKAAAITIWNGIKAFFVSAGIAIKNTVIKMWNGIKSFMIKFNLFTVGKNIIQGLIKGIASMASAVWNKVKSIAGGIKKTIKGALGINSPSKVMDEEVGKWIPHGIAQGIDKNVNVVHRSMMGMGKGMIPVMPKGLGLTKKPSKNPGPNSGKNPMVIENVIVMDGKEIARGSRQHIDSMMTDDLSIYSFMKGMKSV
jgi:tape measure domain-containing protein